MRKVVPCKSALKAPRFFVSLAQYHKRPALLNRLPIRILNKFTDFQKFSVQSSKPINFLAVNKLLEFYRTDIHNLYDPCSSRWTTEHVSRLEEVKHQSCKSKEKGKPGQRSVKRDSTNFKSTSSVFCIENEQGDVATIFERMAFIPVS